MGRKHWLAVAALLCAVTAFEAYLWLRAPAGGGSAGPPGAFSGTRDRLEPGERVPSFLAERLEGGEQSIDFSEEGGNTVICVLSLTCGTCAKTIPQWNRIARDTRGRARTFGLVLGSYQLERELVRKKALDFPALRFSDPEMAERYKLYQVPQTLVVGPGGRVRQVFVGSLDDDEVRRIVKAATATVERGT